MESSEAPGLDPQAPRAQNHCVSKKSRRRTRKRSPSRRKPLRIPPWLFWTIVITFAAAVLTITIWSLINPPQP